MKLYHFTALLHLPSILKEGLRKGEVPIRLSLSPPGVVHGPNFTTSPSESGQSSWTGGALDKTKVRLTVEVPEDERFHHWKTLVKQRGHMSSRDMKALDRYGQGKFWYVYLGNVPAANILIVELREDGQYQPISGADLDALVAEITQEARKLVTFTCPDTGALMFDPEKTGECWLLDGPSRKSHREIVMPSGGRVKL